MTLPDLAPLGNAGGLAFFDPFALHARLDFDLDDRESADNGPVLVHEYTHYLQSVSTVYGLYRVLDWIRTGVRLASVLPSLGEIRIPLRDWWQRDDCPAEVRAQMAQIEMRLGLNVDLEQPDVLHDVAFESLGPLHLARVTLSDGEPHIMAVMPLGDGAFIPIGARALAEGMAASAQRAWEDEPRLDTLLAAIDPEVAGWYTATRDLLRELVGSGEDLDFINAFVCDAAMMTRNPPASFVHAVVAIAGAGATTRRAVVDAVREAMHDIVEEEIASMREDLTATIGRLDDEPFAQSIRRLLTSCLELLDRRAAQTDFPISILCGERPEELEPLLLRYPLPCYFRGAHLLAWHDDDALRLLGRELLMMEHVLRILLWGPQNDRECPLTASPSCESPKTILCATAPWRLGVAADGTVCAFTSALATFGAIGKVVERR